MLRLLHAKSETEAASYPGGLLGQKVYTPARTALQTPYLRGTEICQKGTNTGLAYVYCSQWE